MIKIQLSLRNFNKSTFGNVCSTQFTDETIKNTRYFVMIPARRFQRELEFIVVRKEREKKRKKIGFIDDSHGFD